MPTVSKSPSQFLRYLRYPGLNTNAGRMPIACYVSLTKGSSKINALINAMTKIVDTDSLKNVQGTVGDTQIALIRKGQANPEAYVTFMNFLWDNQEALEGVKGTLGEVYKKYFSTSTSTNALARMAIDNYLGYCCIGFVGQYLRYAGVWKNYKGVDIDQWKGDYGGFTEKIGGADAVQPLQLMIWPRSTKGHVAIIDSAKRMSGNMVQIDMCQSSAGGPQCNRGVMLIDNGGTLEGRRSFMLQGGSPEPPVAADCYIVGYPDLRYGGGPVSQSGGKAASGSY